MARPRQFDFDGALRVALTLFWEKGFDGVSLTDLAAAMGIVRPSLQAAYGSKEDLYCKAIELYGREAMAFVVDALRGKTAVDVCRLFLLGYCDVLSKPDAPKGCFMIKSLVSNGTGAPIARAESVIRQKSYETLLEQRFRQAQADGDLAAEVDARALAECLMVMANGLAVRGEMGAGRADLYRIAEFALDNLF